MTAAALLQPILFLAPALLLWALLALGRYPGEGVVARLARRSPRLRARRSPPVSRRAPALPARRPRSLLACSLAGRAPPPGAQPRW